MLQPTACMYMFMAVHSSPSPTGSAQGLWQLHTDPLGTQLLWLTCTPHHSGSTSLNTKSLACTRSCAAATSRYSGHTMFVCRRCQGLTAAAKLDCCEAMAPPAHKKIMLKRPRCCCSRTLQSAPCSCRQSPNKYSELRSFSLVDSACIDKSHVLGEQVQLSCL